jgi:hypothetical protein
MRAAFVLLAAAAVGCQTADPCPTTLSECGGDCVDTRVDGRHCGGCSGAGGTICGDTCVSLLTDDAHCGDLRPATDCDGQWSWHVDPATPGFADFTVEVCDACPAYVEAHLPDLVAIGWCPWTARVVAVERRPWGPAPEALP